MTETQPGTEPTDGKDADWNRQASTFDWEGWIAEENAADAARAEVAAKADAEAAAFEAQQRSFPAAQLGYPAPAGQAPVAGFPPPSSWPPPQGFDSVAPPAPAPSTAYGYSSPDGHPMPIGYAQPGVPFQAQAQIRIPTGRPVDVVSILALIFGILPTIPVGFVLGIIGIVRTANPVRRGRWMAVTGLVLSVLWGVGIVGGLAYFGSHLAQRDASGAVVKKGVVAADQLRVGDCFEQSATAANGTKNLITVIPCAQPHNAQIFASVTLTGNWSPTVLQRATAACQPKAVAYFKGTGAHPTLAAGAFYPTKSDWDNGKRAAMCVALDSAKDFIGDIKNDR